VADLRDLDSKDRDGEKVDDFILANKVVPLTFAA